MTSHTEFVFHPGCGSPQPFAKHIWWVIQAPLLLKFIKKKSVSSLDQWKKPEKTNTDVVSTNDTHRLRRKSTAHYTTLRLMIVSTWAWKSSCGAASTWNPSSILYCSAKTNPGLTSGIVETFEEEICLYDPPPLPANSWQLQACHDLVSQSTAT